MRNCTLHATLARFTTESGNLLSRALAAGAEIPFELASEPGGTAALYCYRPLTGRFIAQHLDAIAALPSYHPAARELGDMEATREYLRLRGEQPVPEQPTAWARAALRVFLSRVFAERSRFGFEPERFERAYTELELALYEGRRTTTVIAPVLGLALEHGTEELVIGGGLTLRRGELVPDAPHEAVYGEGSEPRVLAVHTLTEESGERAPTREGRATLRRLLTTLRLFERGSFALGELAWTRADGGAWRVLPLGGSGRAGRVGFLGAAHEPELRSFHHLLGRRLPAEGEVGWALARYEMGCDRADPLQALSDHLLALRALLEPEGPASGRLAGRVAAVCGQPEERLAMTERTARAAALERSLMAGLPAGDPHADSLVAELAEHLRAILRDVLCGHLDPDVRSLADELLAEAAAALA